ncbi:MAG: BtpA/SgcQ family protein [Rhizobiaceae bacterium]
MTRSEFRKRFSANRVAVFPVIHVLDNEQAEHNTHIAVDGGCAGVFLINHDFAYPHFLPIIKHVRKAFPDLWLGVNFLAVTGKDAFPVLAELEAENIRVDGYWADDARIDESGGGDGGDSGGDGQFEASEILDVKKACGWDGMYFGGTAFKKQRDVKPDDYKTSATIARNFMDVVTTSGIATGHSADLGKIEIFRQACGETPLALASGITPDNIAQYAPLVDAVLVATGINVKDDFYNIDPVRLAQLNVQINLGDPT